VTLGRPGESNFVPAGALECVAPAGGANWAAAQERGGSDLFSCFCFFFAVFPAIFYWLVFCDFYLVSAFSEFIGI
jgi:hypothetical protein